MFLKMKLLLSAILTFCIFFADAQKLSKPVTIQVDLTKKTAEQLKPVWSFFGYDEANYTYMKDGKKLLSEIAAASPAPVYVRCHNLLTTGDGSASLKWGSTNAYTEDAKGNTVYNWKITDSIFDTYIKLGMKPLAQIGFMPEALSVKPESDGSYTSRHYHIQHALHRYVSPLPTN